MAAITDLTYRATDWAVLWVDTRDQRLMRRVNHWRAPKWLRLWMIAATRGGDGWLWLSMAFLVAVFGGEHRVAALSSAVVAGGVGVAVLDGGACTSVTSVETGIGGGLAIDIHLRHGSGMFGTSPAPESSHSIVQL